MAGKWTETERASWRARGQRQLDFFFPLLLPPPTSPPSASRPSCFFLVSVGGGNLTLAVPLPSRCSHNQTERLPVSAATAAAAAQRPLPRHAYFAPNGMGGMAPVQWLRPAMER